MDINLNIKNNLINRIMSIDDINFLQALQTIFDVTDKNLFQLSDEQNASIEISRKQIASGEYKDNETVLSDLRQWLISK
jgi:hypothetical protein